MPSLLLFIIIGGILVLFILAILAFVLPRFRNQKLGSSSYDAWDLKGDGTTSPLLPTTFVNTFAGNTSATLRVFYFIKSLPRTTTSDSLNATSFNQVTNNFDVCNIANSTTGCFIHPGFVKLLNFENSCWIELLQTPDASRPGLPKTQLCIRTTQVSTQTRALTGYIETFSLPAFPLQKWVMLTLVREGSRFDIYYNSILQASIKTMYVPAINSVNCSLSSSQVRGKVEYPFSIARVSTGYDVSADYTAITDTRGEPIPLYFSRSPGTFSLCPSGNCFGGPTMKPANPLLEWKTNYM